MNDLIDLLRTSGLSGWVAFAVLYHVGTRGAWRRSEFGPWIMTLAVLPLFVLVVGLAAAQFGRDAWYVQILRLGLMLVLNVLPVWLAAHLIRVQTDRARAREDDTHEDLRT